VKVYIAGPLFTPEQRVLLERIDEMCRGLGWDTYLPHRDAGLFDRSSGSSERFFRNDMLQLEESDLVLAVLDGCDVDSGTAWELGYFYRLQKGPIVGYVGDVRIADPERQINPMVYHSLKSLARDLDELKRILDEL